MFRKCKWGKLKLKRLTDINNARPLSFPDVHDTCQDVAMKFWELLKIHTLYEPINGFKGIKWQNI